MPTEIIFKNPPRRCREHAGGRGHQAWGRRQGHERQDHPGGQHGRRGEAHTGRRAHLRGQGWRGFLKTDDFFSNTKRPKLGIALACAGTL